MHQATVGDAVTTLTLSSKTAMPVQSSQAGQRREETLIQQRYRARFCFYLFHFKSEITRSIGSIFAELIHV